MVSFFAKSVLVVGLVSTALSAQVTHRITGDKLQATIGKAKAGDIILVNGGFAAVTTLNIDKPLYIHATKVALFGTTFVNISKIPKGAELVLSGFTFMPQVYASRCEGRLLLFNLTHGTYSFSNCEDVTMTNCDTGWIEMTGSRLEVSGSKVTGRRFSTRYPMFRGTHGIKAAASKVTIWDSTILGGWQYGDLSPVNLHQSSLWVNRARLENRLVGGKASAVDGTGSIVYDPSVAMVLETGARAFGADVSATRRALPLFTMPPTAIGSGAVATLYAPAGTTYGMFVGWPGAAVKLPGIVGALEVAQPVLVQVGKMPITRRATLSFTVPSTANLRGRMFRWQGITVNGAVAEWSNAVTECHY